ncbi:hypothetical protein M3Y97_00646200 [Aphelenchoides bicaudatus]|nr:hypothetical protein M3Y97_00646200 [Aphelenchoides bicaudatus]
MQSISNVLKEVRYFLTTSVFQVSNSNEQEIIAKEPEELIEGLSAHEFKLRRLVYMEFQKENSVARAVENINSKLGAEFITKANVSALFKRFSSGDLSFFNKDTRLYALSQQSPGPDNGISRALHSTLLFDNDPHFYENLTVIDGWIAVNAKTCYKVV